MIDETIRTLVPSANRGSYALDDGETGHDLTAGEPVAIFLGGQWIEGHIEHSGHYEEPGCYAISDSGKSRKHQGPQTQAEFQASMHAAIAQGTSLQDALQSVSSQVSDVFCGYYFSAADGTVSGLCTGMKVRLR